MELTKQNYKKSEFGLIPENWNFDLLDKHCKRGSGHTPNKKLKENYEGEIVWVSLADSERLDKGKINSSLITISAKGIANSSAVLHPKGTVLMSRDAGIGKSAVADCPLCVSQHFMVWLCNEKTLHNWYLYYWLQFQKSEFERIAIGSTIKTIGLPYFKQYKIVLPSYNEQIKIATNLIDIDSFISNLEKLIIKKKNIKYGTIQQLLTPPTKGGKRLEGFKDEWKEFFVHEVVWFQEGPGVRKYQFTKDGVKLLNGTNINNGKLDLDSTDKFISESEANSTYKHFLADKGDIIIACSGITIDRFDEKVTYVKQSHLPLCMNTSTMRFKMKSDKIHNDFFVHFLKSKEFKKQIGGQATGSAQLNFGPSHMNKIKIYLPPINEQIYISKILSDMDAEIYSYEIKYSKYQNIKKGVMQELLTGKTILI